MRLQHTKRCLRTWFPNLLAADMPSLRSTGTHMRDHVHDRPHLNNSLTIKFDLLDIFHSRLLRREAGGLSIRGMGVARADGIAVTGTLRTRR